VIEKTIAKVYNTTRPSPVVSPVN